MPIFQIILLNIANLKVCLNEFVFVTLASTKRNSTALEGIWHTGGITKINIWDTFYPVPHDYAGPRGAAGTYINLRLLPWGTIETTQPTTL